MIKGVERGQQRACEMYIRTYVCTDIRMYVCMYVQYSMYVDSVLGAYPLSLHSVQH